MLKEKERHGQKKALKRISGILRTWSLTKPFGKSKESTEKQNHTPKRPDTHPYSHGR